MRNLFAAIEARRSVPLNRFIFALGIRHVGETTAKVLARHFGTIEALRAAVADGAQAGPPDSASSRMSRASGLSSPSPIGDFFGEPHNLEVIDALLAQVTPQPLEAVAAKARSRARPWSSPARWRR